MHYQSSSIPQRMQPGRPPPSDGPLGTLKKIFAPLAVALLLLFKFGAKLKFIILPLLKFLPVLLKTGGTMILMVWVYAMAWGWWFAAGFVLLILVHECGHLVAARRHGLRAGAPVFIPFLGAFIALKDAPRNAWVEAQVGIGGPLLGTAGAVLCVLLFMGTKQPIFLGLAYTGFFLNLFNLMPVGFLDGGRIVTALSPWLWIAGLVLLVGYMILHFNFMLLFILVASLPRLFSLFRKRSDEEKRFFEVTPGQRLVMGALYFGLIGVLVLGMKHTMIAV